MGKTDFLFARPSFLEGMARTIDISGTLDLYNESQSEAEADAIAIYNDFKMVGQDLNLAIKTFKTQNENE